MDLVLPFNWLLLSFLCFSLFDFGFNLKKIARSYIITITLSFTAIVLAGLAGKSIILVAFYLLIFTFSATYVSIKKPTYFVAAFILTLFTILACMPQLSLLLDVIRALSILVGALLAMLFKILSTLLALNYLAKKHQQQTYHFLQQLNAEIFACFLSPDYPKNLYLYEHRLHNAKSNYYLSIYQLRQIAQVRPQLNDRIDRLECIFINLLDMAQMRFRVKDHNLFSIAKQELKEIEVAINDCLINKRINGEEKLEASLQLFEEQFEHVLQVTSKEPMVFYLFIVSIKSLIAQFKQSGLEHVTA